jgi:beta-lactamase regulating signal transducer with metallopeptidase domain
MRTISQPLLTFLLNACWQIALIAAVAALCSWLLRGTTARCQHLLWVTALAFSFGLPIMTCAPLLGGAFFSEPPRTTIQPTDEALEPAAPLVMDTQASLPTAPPAALEETAPFILLVNRNVAAVIVVLYLLFLCYRSGKLFMAWRRARSLKRSAYPIELPEHVRSTVSECQSVLGVRQVQVLCSTSIPAPIAVGSFNPLIILPEQLFKETDRGVLTAAIGHELVHVMRRDYLLNLIYELISLPLSFHPATALVKRRIRETRELGCDELVTEKLLDASVYARSLVHLAGSAINLSRPGATIAVGVADADILEERVMSILRRPRINTRRRNLSLVAAALVFVVPCVAAAPFAFRIGVDPQSTAVSSDDSIVAPHASDVVVQQVAKQKAKQEERATEEQRRKLRELREEALARRAAEVEAMILEARQLHDALEMQEAEVRKKLRDGSEMQKEEVRKEVRKKLRDASEMQEMEGRKKLGEGAEMQEQELEGRKKLGEGAEKLRDEHEAKKPPLKLKAQRKLESQIIYSLVRKPAKKANIAELAKKANITMQQAIQIAMSQQPGTVMQCRLISEQPAGERDQVFYILTIVSGDEQKSASTTMLISAVDGRVVRTWKNKR